MIVGFKRDDYTTENRLLGINETGEPVTKVIDAGNFHQEKFGSNIQITDEPMFGDGVLQFTNYANTMNQDSSVTYQINTEIEGIYQLHAIIGAKNKKINYHLR